MSYIYTTFHCTFFFLLFAGCVFFFLLGCNTALIERCAGGDGLVDGERVVHLFTASSADRRCARDPCRKGSTLVAFFNFLFSSKISASCFCFDFFFCDFLLWYTHTHPEFEVFRSQFSNFPPFLNPFWIVLFNHLKIRKKKIEIKDEPLVINDYYVIK